MFAHFGHSIDVPNFKFVTSSASWHFGHLTVRSTTRVISIDAPGVSLGVWVVVLTSGIMRYSRHRRSVRSGRWSACITLVAEARTARVPVAIAARRPTALR
jgi:hypothetical protein